MTRCTYYQDAGDRPCANGKTYAQNRRAFGYFCASNRYGLGTRLLVSRGGQQVRVVVADRIGRGSDCDLCAAAFRHLAGRRWHVIGRLHVQVRLLGAKPKRKGH